MSQDPLRAALAFCIAADGALLLVWLPGDPGSEEGQPGGAWAD